MTNKLIVKDPFEMPAVDDTAVLVLRECADLVPHCWIWNESVGYLEVVEYSGYDIYVTVKNVGMKENATSGTIFPSCMEFLITAPNATPIIDNTVTCLRADFKCPTVGQEALMSVDSTSAIRTGDLIIVDTRYQYLVTEIINEHTMKVLNEEKGKEGGVINVNCNECVPVKIFESTHCCEALQEQVDDIYNRLNTKKSITPATDSLISVANGNQVLTDAFNDVVLNVDTDLSKYDNTVSRFITSNDIPSLPNDIDLSHYDNATSRFITLNDIPQIPTVNDATLTIYNSDGVTPFIEFSANASEAATATLPQSGNTYTADSPLIIDSDNKITISQASATTDGYLSSTDWNTFNSKYSFDNTGILLYHTTDTTGIRPIVGEEYIYSYIGTSSYPFTNGYITDLTASKFTINDIKHSEVANIIVQTSNFDFSNVTSISNLNGSNPTISTDTISITNSYSHTIKCLIDVDMLASRLRVFQGTEIAQVDVSLKGYIEISNLMTSSTNTNEVSTWYRGEKLYQDTWYEVCPTFTYTNVIDLDANTSYKIRAYTVLSFPGVNSNTIISFPGGVAQRGFMRITLIVQ